MLRTGSGATPLHVAAAHGPRAVVQALLHAGADPISPREERVGAMRSTSVTATESAAGAAVGAACGVAVGRVLHGSVRLLRWAAEPRPHRCCQHAARRHSPHDSRQPRPLRAPSLQSLVFDLLRMMCLHTPIIEPD